MLQRFITICKYHSALIQMFDVLLIDAVWVMSSVCCGAAVEGVKLNDYYPCVSWQPSVLHTSFPWWRSRTWTAAPCWEASRWSWRGRTSAPTPRWFSWRRLKVGWQSHCNQSALSVHLLLVETDEQESTAFTFLCRRWQQTESFAWSTR